MSDLHLDGWETACFEFQDGRISDKQFRERMMALGFDEWEIQDHIWEIENGG